MLTSECWKKAWRPRDPLADSVDGTETGEGYSFHVTKG